MKALKEQVSLQKPARPKNKETELCKKTSKRVSKQTENNNYR